MRQLHHPAIVMRLKRADGHLKSVIEMFDRKHTCVDLVQQLHAVEKAIANAKSQLIQDHMDHCLKDDAAEGTIDARGILDELKALTKYL